MPNHSASMALGEEHSQGLLEPSQTTAMTGTTSKFPKFGGGIAFEKDGEFTVESQITWGGGSGQAAGPHHLPKMNEALQNRLDMIKKTMDLNPVRDSPWDQQGVPLRKKKGSPKHKEAKAHK